MQRFFLIVPVILALGACSNYYNKNYQKISVHTPGIENVQCILETPVNKYIVLTPGVVNVNRSDETLTLTCEKATYLKQVQTVESKIRMVPSQLDVFTGIVPGLVYDIASDSIYAYPDKIVVNMRPDPNRVELEPKEVRVLQLKKRPVTAKEVREAVSGEEEDAGVTMDDLLDDEADKLFSDTLRK